MTIRYPYRKYRKVIETYQGSYGNLTAEGRRRLIRILELALIMSTSDLIQAISDLKEMEPTV